MKRAPLVALGALIVTLSLWALALGLSESRARLLGLSGLAGLGVVLAVLGIALYRERERLVETRRALARSRVRADVYASGSPDGVVLLDGTRIEEANPAFRALLGVAPDESLAGRDLLELVAEREREAVARWIDARRRGEREPEHLRITGLRVTGVEILLEAAAAIVPVERGARLALFARDVSGQQRVELRSRYLERVEALADIAESLAGDFQSLLRRVRETARGGLRGEEEARESLERVERLSSRALAMIRRVRSFAPNAVDRSGYRAVDLARLVDETCDDYRSRGPGLDQPIEVRHRSSEALPAHGEPAQVRHALWELLDNAREAGEGRTITIETTLLELDRVSARRHPGGVPGRYALIEVRDTGPGMDEGTRMRAMQPFFTTKGARATGLGLSTALATVRAHGGFGELDSKPGVGTRVRLAFPLSAETESELPIAENRDDASRWRGRENVLVVDDDPPTRAATEELLESYGYHVEAAADAAQALERLRQRPRVDLVLLDLVLPGRSGLELLRRITRVWPGLRVLTTSPYPLPDQEAQALQIGAAGTLRRPLGDPRLPRAVRVALDRPPPSPLGEKDEGQA